MNAYLQLSYKISYSIILSTHFIISFYFSHFVYLSSPPLTHMPVNLWNNQSPTKRIDLYFKIDVLFSPIARIIKNIFSTSKMLKAHLLSNKIPHYYFPSMWDK